MSRRLISALSLVPLPAGVPDEIVYLPEGESAIWPTVNGAPAKEAVTVRVPPEKGEQIAAALQADLDKRHAANVRPWFDFEHKRGAASALPQSFRYQPGKGIMAKLEWTSSGRVAIEGKDYSYFSPEFYLGDDGIPDGLPAKGPLGGLVNEPAFREIPRIAASEAHPSTPPPPPMSKLIFAALAISAAAENAEAEAVDKIKAMQYDGDEKKKRIAELEAELATLKGEKDQVMASLAQIKKDRAETLVKAAIADGRIAPKDEEKATKFRDRIAAGDAFAEDILATLPKTHADLGKSLIQGSGNPAPGAGGEHALEAKARALVAAGSVTNLDDAIARVAASEPALYSQYLGTLS